MRATGGQELEAKLQPIETALAKNFLPELLEEPADAIAMDSDLYGLPVRQIGLVVQKSKGFGALS